MEIKTVNFDGEDSVFVYIKGSTQKGKFAIHKIEIKAIIDYGKFFTKIKDSAFLAGWTHVRHVPSGTKWHTSSDNLAGTSVYGTPSTLKNAPAWSKNFGVVPFDQFIFATGDLGLWIQVSREEAIGTFYDGKDKTIMMSEHTPTSSKATFYNRDNNPEDPIF